MQNDAKWRHQDKNGSKLHEKLEEILFSFAHF